MTFVFALIFLLALWTTYITKKTIKQGRKLDEWAKRIEEKHALIEAIKIKLYGKEKTEKKQGSEARTGGNAGRQ